MTALVEHTLELAGERRCTLRMERSDRLDPRLADVLVDIDLKCFVEATYSRYTAVALLQSGAVFLLKADDAVVGACVCIRSYEVPHEAHLLTMGILPGWRGQHLGQRFVSWVLDALALDGFSSVSLLVGSGNARALRIYEDVGFQVAREVDTEPASDERQLLLRASLEGRAAAFV